VTADYVRLGDVLVPDRVHDGMFRFLPGEGETVLFTATVDAAVVEGTAVCTRLVIEQGTEPVTRRMLGQIDPPWLAASLLADHGEAPLEGHPGVYSFDRDATWEALTKTPQRRKLTSARLAEVATAYRRGGVPGVRRDCDISQPSAYRLVREARRAGALGEDERPTGEGASS
jgi:hypothetical protein